MKIPLVPFSKIEGQEAAKEILLRAYCKNRTSHAYIFRGPFGVGKKTTALSFAAYVNCKNHTSQNYCGTCPSCQKFATGNHPDFLLVESPGSGIKIDQVRKVKKTLTFPPFEAEYRVIVFTDIHDGLRRREVANSLLKTLEEPPENTLFILTADETGEILPTILSRGQIVRFLPLTREVIQRNLVKKKEIEATQAHVLADLAGGSLGKALGYAESNLLELRRELIIELNQLERESPEAGEIIITRAGELAHLKENLYDFLTLLTLWVRDLILFAQQTNNVSLVHQDLAKTYEQSLNWWSLKNLFEKLVAINSARRQLERNCNKNAVCEVLIWDLLSR